ncbi:MAG: ABC transporter ATP-binding protein [Microbacteriaceae bacterium]|nr:ABC transporter ATP-binding protein [Microbacteriaceae bacterium]
MSENNGGRTPSKQDKLRPLELLALSAVLAIFTGAVVAVATRDWERLVPISAGAAFIVCLMMLALFGLSSKPNAEDVIARRNAERIAAQNRFYTAEPTPVDPETDQNK